MPVLFILISSLRESFCDAFSQQESCFFVPGKHGEVESGFPVSAV
jgi:hypothetical protein